MTVHAASLESDYDVTSTPTTFLTTASLPVGTWLINFGASVILGEVGICAIEVVEDSAVATLTGQLSAEATNPDSGSSSGAFIGFTCKAAVTTAGTLAFQAVGSGNTQTSVIATTSQEGLGSATGYTAASD